MAAIVLSVILAMFFCTLAADANPVRTSWQTEAQRAKIAMPSDPHSGAMHLIKCMQILQTDKSASNDTRVKDFLICDVLSSTGQLQSASDALLVATWEYSTAFKIFGAHSALTCLALADMAMFDKSCGMEKAVSAQLQLTLSEQLEFNRICKIRQKLLRASIGESFAQVQKELDRLN